MAPVNRFLHHLSSRSLEEITPYLRREWLASGQNLFRAEGTISHIHFPSSGIVSLVAELSHREVIETAIVGNDGIVGGQAALGNLEAPCTAVVQIAGEGHSLDVASAQHIARTNEEFRAAITRYEGLILGQAQQSAACNAKHTIDQRLARWLLRVRDLTGSNSFSLTQEFLSEMMGVTRSSVSTIAHHFQKLGLISYRRGQITIDDLDRLHSRACECYDVIKARADRFAAGNFADNAADTKPIR
jgi:CRP-like cAMP-binding protein